MRAIDADAIINKINNMVFTADMTTTLAVNMATRWIDNEPTIEPEPHWIPVMDGDGKMPPVDEDGYSDWILISFANMNQLVIGQYRVDDDGGAFYDGDDEEPLTKWGLIVNAWMPVPKPYRPEEEG